MWGRHTGGGDGLGGVARAALNVSAVSGGLGGWWVSCVPLSG